MDNVDVAFELAEIANELFARESGANSIGEDYHDKPYTDLCDRIVALAKELKAQAPCYTIAMEGPNRFKKVGYTPKCRYGYTNCISDPAYIEATYPEWYKQIAEFCVNCIDGDCYDDEDK